MVRKPPFGSAVATSSTVDPDTGAPFDVDDVSTDDARGDLLLIRGDERLLVDVTVVRPTAPTHLRNARLAVATKGLACAVAAESAKRAKYGALCTERGWKMCAFALESYGALGQFARKLLHTLASKADEASRKRIAELEAMLAAVRATGDRSDTEIRNQSDISRREAEELKKRLAEASAELARLRVQPRATPFETRAQSDLRADQEQLLTENSRLAATARTQGETLAGLRSQLAAAERSLATAREQAAAEKAALQAAIDRLTADNQRLSSAVPAPASADGAGKDAATRELAALQTQLKTLAAEHEIALRKNSDEVSALNTQLKRVRDANRVLAETNKALLEAKAAE